jgi:cyclopropane-fatty-acyl-phospholipid synthase
MATTAGQVEPGGPAAATAATLRALDVLLANLEPRDFGVRLWSGETVPPAPGERARFTLVLNGPGALARMLWPPGELSAAEAFLRGDFDVEGDLVAAMSLRRRFRVGLRDALALLPRAPTLLRAPRSGAVERAARLRGRRHTPDRDAAAVRHHYDLGNDFYALWLDRRMVYSCAWFADPGVSLDDAQEAKLELLCRKLRLRAGERLLDVGCGWGGLVVHAAERHGVEAVGITLSPSQAGLARRRIAERGLEGRCRIEVADYRRLAEPPFDKVVSVGMVEHVGLERLDEYFRTAHRLLRPGGVFLNHGISPGTPRRGGLRSRVLRRGEFLDRYVFPDARIPPLHEAARAALHAGLELRDVESLREHYALTLRHWLARLEARAADARRLVGDPTFRTWRLYLAGSADAFDTGENTVFQALFVRPDAGRSGLPWTRGDWYAEPPGAGASRRGR